MISSLDLTATNMVYQIVQSHLGPITPGKMTAHNECVKLFINIINNVVITAELKGWPTVNRRMPSNTAIMINDCNHSLDKLRNDCKYNSF